MPLTNVLLFSTYFDKFFCRASFYFAFFSMTSAYVEIEASIEKIGKVARTSEQIKLAT